MTQIIHSSQSSWSIHEFFTPPVCVTCSKNTGFIIRMIVKRNGVSIPYGHNSAQIGDLLVCPVCHIEIVQGFSKVLGKSVSDQVLDSESAILKGVQDILV